MSVMTHFLLWSVGLAKPWTFYGSAECHCLARHVCGKRRVVEIGCWHGLNTRRLRAGMTRDGVLFCVDPYPVGRLGFSAPLIIARREVSRVSNGSVRWIRLTDVDAARQFRESAEDLVDFVFSDSLNTFEGMRATWEAWSPLVAPNGIYIIANSHSTPARQIETAGSVRFTRDVIRRDPRFEWRETIGCFTVLRRRDHP